MTRQISSGRATIGAAVIAVVAALIGAFVAVVGDTALDRRAATRSACVNLLTSAGELQQSAVSLMRLWTTIDFSEPDIAKQQVEQTVEESKAIGAGASEMHRAFNEILLIARPEMTSALKSYMARATDALATTNAWLPVIQTSVKLKLRELIQRRSMGMAPVPVEPPAEWPKPPREKWQLVEEELSNVADVCRQQTDRLFLLASERKG
jgi:hypothetical protein